MNQQNPNNAIGGDVDKKEQVKQILFDNEKHNYAYVEAIYDTPRKTFNELADQIDAIYTQNNQSKG